MKNIFLIIITALIVSCGQNEKEKSKVQPAPDTTRTKPGSQENTLNPYAGVDISPMDMTYFPVNFPQQRMSGQAGEPLARIIYSRPHLQGRRLFKDVLKYGEPWRLGANEATELELFRDATVQGKKIRAGRYVLYCVPQDKNWVIKLNSNIDSWGLNPNPAKDIASFDIPVNQTTRHIEYFTIVFSGENNSGMIIIAWDNLEVQVPITF